MSKLIYVHDDDNKLPEILLQALKENGYSTDHADLTNRPSSEHIRADIAFLCTNTIDTQRITVGDLTLDLDNISAYLENGNRIHFTPIEFSMLSYLMKNVHRAVPRDELLSAVWGFDGINSTRVADDTAKRLRRKLQNTTVVLETVWNFGFRVRKK